MGFHLSWRLLVVRVCSCNRGWLSL